ncbi:PQQ-dependent sugar dehydrogenase, partial [Candidatus Roizmanbacteria bacterium]|nr:PQQ-dependent sugar dehydrogenase [Candidatus Roizmanbacteria bacterium]
MKQRLFMGFGILLMLAIGYGAWWYWQNLRGAGPAFTPPTANIVNLIEQNKPNTPLSPGQNKTDFPLSIPDGFTISIFAEGLGKARVLQQDTNGTILVSSLDKGQVIALPDQNNDGMADNQVVLLNNQQNPHGLYLDCQNDNSCTLYVAQEQRVSSFDYLSNPPRVTNEKQMITLPRGGRHFTRTLLINPANRDELLISIGSTCDVCVENNPIHGSIQVFNLQTKQLAPFATGLRNSVFMTNRPETDEVWATEMGRDHLGDDLPPDEINRIVQDGNYGWPYAYGKNQEDKTFPFPRKEGVVYDIYTIPSHIDLPAHSAPLGLAFVPPNSKWPEAYWGNLFVSFHGSWNRTEPTGYKIVRFI